jgi:hypothetical protein
LILVNIKWTLVQTLSHWRAASEIEALPKMGRNIGGQNGRQSDSSFQQITTAHKMG